MDKKQLQREIQNNRGGTYAGMFTKGLEGGVEVDYFNYVPNMGYEHTIPVIRRHIASNDLKQLHPVYVTGISPDHVFSYWWEGSTHDGTFIRCDKEQITKQVTPSGVVNWHKSPCLDKLSGRVCSCNRVGRLHIWSHDINRTLGEHVRFVVRTGSKRDIVEIGSRLRDAYEMYTVAHGINFTKIPFILTRIPDKWTYKDDEGAEQEQTHHFISLRVAPDFVRQYSRASLAVQSTEPSRIGYVAYIDQQLLRHVPELNFETVTYANGYNVPEFVERFNVEQAKDKVLEYVTEHKIPIHLSHSHCHVWELKDRKHYVYHLNTGFGDVISHERKMFRDAGWDVDSWRGENKRIHIHPAIPVLLKKKSGGDTFIVSKVLPPTD